MNTTLQVVCEIAFTYRKSVIWMNKKHFAEDFFKTLKEDQDIPIFLKCLL